MIRSFAFATLLGGTLVGCGASAPPPKAPAAAPTLPSGALYEVFGAAGRQFVVLGAAAAPPATRSAPVVIGHGVAVEIADEKPLSAPVTVTVVDETGACVSTASSSVKLGGAHSWLDALVIDGCRSDPSRQRLALSGEVTDARWLEPLETLTADGAAVPTSGFYEGDLGGKKMLHQARFTGLELVFQRAWVEPPSGPIATRVLSGDRPIAAYYADVVGAVRARGRWLFVMHAHDQRSVMELKADTLVPVLGTPPAPAPIAEPAEPTTEAATPDLSGLPDPATLSGAARVFLRSKGTPKGSVATTVKSIAPGERVTVELAETSGRVHRLELALPKDVPLRLQAGDAVAFAAASTGVGPKRRDSVRLEAPDGSLLLESGTDASGNAGWKVEREGAVRFTHSGQTVEVPKDEWRRLDTAGASYLLWGSANFAIVRVR